MSRSIMFRIGLGASAFWLAACAQHPPITTLVPVPTSCVHGDLPDEPPLVGPELTGDSGHDIGVIAGSALALRAWGVAERGMLVACQAR